MSNAANYSQPTSTVDDPLAESEPLRLVIPPQLQGERLDKALATLWPDLSRARIQRWIAAGQVWVDGRTGVATRKVVAGEVILASPLPDEASAAFVPEPISLDIVGEGPGFIVINKPAGLVVHPGAGNWRGTLLNGLLHAYPDSATLARAGLVHRLDKDTSGLMVVARDANTQLRLVRAIQDRQVKRVYLALAHGHLPEAAIEGLRLDAAIGRDPRQPIRMSSLELHGATPIAAKPALTRVRLLALGVLDGRPCSVVGCWLDTGRTHQIRVHLAGLGHPLLGDSLYGGPQTPHANRQMLHASLLAFAPRPDETPQLFTATPPADFCMALAQAQWAKSVSFEQTLLPALQAGATA